MRQDPEKIQGLPTFNLELYNMRFKSQSAIKNHAEKSGLLNNWNQGAIQCELRISMMSGRLTEVYTNCLGFGKLEPILICPFFEFIQALLQLSFNSVHVLSSIADQKVIYLEGTFHALSETLHYAIDLNVKKSDRQNTSLRNTHILFKFIRDDGYQANIETAILPEVFNEQRNLTSQIYLMEVSHAPIFSSIIIGLF